MRRIFDVTRVIIIIPADNVQMQIASAVFAVQRHCLRKSQLDRQNSRNSTSSSFIIEMVQTNVAATILKNNFIIEETLTSYVFLNIIYIKIDKLIGTLSITL